MNRDELQQRAMAVKELTRSEGWQILMEELHREIEARKVDKDDIVTEGRSSNDVGVEYIGLSSEIKGLKRVEEIAESVIRAYEE